MKIDFSLTIVREGTTKLIVPADYSSSGPSTSSMPVFYNPAMEFNRDVSVAILANQVKDDQSLLDGLAAAGSRGIRIAHESGKKIRLHLNDRNPLSVEIAERNLKLNNISDAVVTGNDLRTILLEKSFDCVDIDPFGSPAQFFPMAISAVRNNGILCVTATDTGTISGIFSNACLRKYGCSARRTPFPHEIGVRNLVGFIAREAARLDAGIEPIASYYSDHYVRTFIRLKKGAKKADCSLKQLGFCYFDDETLDRFFSDEQEKKSIGPIWTAATCDSSIISNLKIPQHLKNADKIVDLFESLSIESGINRPFFNVDEFARKLKMNPPKMDVLLTRLNEIGRASKTHYDTKTFKTDVSIEDIRRMFVPNC